jgi:hypothetical protein
VDESLLAALLGDGRARGRFPWLNQAALGILAARDCCGARPTRHSADLRALKERVMRLEPDAMRALKGFLQVEKLVFHAQGPRGLVTLER